MYFCTATCRTNQGHGLFVAAIVTVELVFILMVGDAYRATRTLRYIPAGFAGEDAVQTAGLNFVFTCSNAGALKTFIQGFERVA